MMCFRCNQKIVEASIIPGTDAEEYVSITKRCYPNETTKYMDELLIGVLHTKCYEEVVPRLESPL